MLIIGQRIMAQSPKRKSVLFLVAASLSIILLAGGLSNLQLQPGSPFPGGGSFAAENPIVDVNPDAVFSFSPLLRGLFAAVFLVFIVDILARLFRLLNRKRTIQLLGLLSLLLLLSSMISHIPGVRPVPARVESSNTESPPGDYPVSPLGEPSPDLLGLATLVFICGATLLAIKLLERRASSSTTDDRLLLEAQTAVNAIRSGENLRNVIVRCYLQMTQALAEEQRIERSDNMTVREFEDWLGLQGFPKGPVHQLGQLYEAVRYGQQEPETEDEQRAMESLERIIEFCRSRRSSASA